MAVALPPFFGLMADYLVNLPLIHALAGERRANAMPEMVLGMNGMDLRHKSLQNKDLLFCLLEENVCIRLLRTR
jgi:hypothetical protein